MVIKGKENNVKLVENDINKYLFNMKVFTIYLMSNDYSLVKSNICQLKTLVDPADLRLRKKEPRNDKEIKHSFYYVPGLTKDLVIIGFENELKVAEKQINEFLLRQNTLEFNYSLCFLCPINLSQSLNNFQNDYRNTLRSKNVSMRIYDPNYIRKHVNVYLEGKWKDITDVKNIMFKYFNTNNQQSSHHKKRLSINDFQQYIYNQEHKLVSKNLRKFYVENFPVKNWDLMSDEVTNSEVLLKNEGTEILHNFLQNPDKDTILNYSLNLPPNGFNNVFNTNRLDFTKSLYNYVEEALDSYNLCRKDGERREQSEHSMRPEESIERSIVIPVVEKDVIMAEPIMRSPSCKSIESVKEQPSNDIKEINMTSNNFSTGIDSIQTTLLNKLNEMMNEKPNFGSLGTGVLENQASSITVNNFASVTSLEDTRKKVYEFIVKEDINALLNKPQSDQDKQNISYNFSNINQMNININISNISDKAATPEDDTTFLRRKHKQFSPEVSGSSYYNKQSPDSRGDYYYKDRSNRKRFHKIRYDNKKDEKGSVSRSLSKDKQFRKKRSVGSASRSVSPIKSGDGTDNFSPGYSRNNYYNKGFSRHTLGQHYRYNNPYYKNNFQRRNNFDDGSIGRKPYVYNKPFYRNNNNNNKPYYQKGFYNNRHRYRNRSSSSSRSNGEKMKEFMSLKNSQFEDFEENCINNDPIEIKSNIKKPNNLN
jgi:hypothetical protein